MIADSNLYLDDAWLHGGGLFSNAPADITDTCFEENTAGEGCSLLRSSASLGSFGSAVLEATDARR